MHYFDILFVKNKKGKGHHMDDPKNNVLIKIAASSVPNVQRLFFCCSMKTIVISITSKIVILSFYVLIAVTRILLYF